MVDALQVLFSAGSFIPHGHCYLWQPGLVWLHVISDLLVAIAYYSIPITLLYFVRRRQDLPFNSIFLMFGAFIVFCGTTHLMEVWTLWTPVYWLSGTLKAATAAVSVYTAIQLVPIVPKALALPSPAQLRQANQELHAQVSERVKAETALKQYQDQLEQIVAERTAQLEASNRRMEELLVNEQILRQQSEATKAELQVYADRLTLALEAAKMGWWDWDVTTNTLYWTPQHETIFGYEPGQSERPYSDWADRVHPADLELLETQLQFALTQRQDFDAEHRLQLPNGETRWVDVFGRGEYDDRTGHPIRMVGVIQDITDRKVAEVALRISEATAKQQLAEIEAIYASTPVGMCVLDREFRFVRINDFLAAINGVSAAAHIGRTVREILPELGDVQERFFQQVVETGQPILNQEVHGTLPSQPEVERDWLVSYYPLQGEGAQVTGINVTALEITERKLAEKAIQERAVELTRLNAILAQTTALLRDRNRELDQFAYVVSHDLKAPLRAIANLSVWLEEDLMEQIPPENKQQLQLMRARVNRMEALINGLLNYSRVGRIEAKIETFSVADLVNEIIDSLAPPASFTIEISPLPTLNARRLLLGQVFSNLLSNAVKHHDRPDGKILISAQERGEFFEFQVTDDGPGIEPQFHAKVFTIFQTLKARDEQENTGVGLSIVKKIVETEGGSIQIESDLGQGTTFRFTWLKHAKEATIVDG